MWICMLCALTVMASMRHGVCCGNNTYGQCEVLGWTDIAIEGDVASFLGVISK